METISRKTELVYEGKSEVVNSSVVIKDLKARADAYFYVKNPKFFLSYKGLIFIYENPIEDDSNLNKMEKAKEKVKAYKNNAFIDCYSQMLIEPIKEPVRI